MPPLREYGMKGKKAIQQGVVTRIPFSANVSFYKINPSSFCPAPVIFGHVQICFISFHYSIPDRHVKLIVCVCGSDALIAYSTPNPACLTSWSAGPL